MSNQQMIQKPEIQRILKELSSKSDASKEKAAQELQQVFYKYVSVSEEIFTKLQKMINNPDGNEKYGGIIGLDYLTGAVQESQVLTFVNRFLSVVFSQFQINTEEKVLRRNAEVFGKLLRQGGSKIAQLVDQNFIDAFKWVKSDGAKERKLAGLLVLKEILIEAPSITFNKMTNNLGPVLALIRSKHLPLREAALDFFSECIKQVSQRELKFQTDILLGVYNSEIKKTINSKEEEVIHGNIMMIKILLTYAKEEVFVNQIKDLGNYVIGKRDYKSPQVIRAVIETLPTLSKLCKDKYLVDFIEIAIQFLLNYAQPQQNVKITPKDKSLCFSTLSELFAPLDDSIAREKAKMVIKSIRDELIAKNKPFCVETIQCLRTIFQIHHKRFQDFTNMDVLVDQILLNGLHPQSVNFLNEICKSLPQYSEYIQYKLLYTIAAILIKKIISFASPGQKQSKNNPEFDNKVLEGFQTLLSEALQNPDFITTESIANAIQTLSTFVFENQQENLAVFVKDAVLPYLSNPNPTIRKATAKAGCLLYVRQSKTLGHQMISKNVMYEILDKFMNVAISDQEQEIRQTMLASLNENFDQYLNAPNNLRKLFLCMNDPVPEVQEIALTILCRLSVLNPSDIVPFLKKTLFEYLQTLTYDSNQPDKQTINQLYLLSSLIKHGRDIVQPYSQNIANVLLQHLRNPNTSAAVISYLLAAFSQLTETQKLDTLIYLNEIFEIIINAMQDKGSTMKRESALRSLNEIIKNTGFVVLPYYNFPNLMDTLLQLVRTEITVEMRQECLRLLGNLGAIDSFNYKNTVSRTRKNVSLYTQKFRFIQRYSQALQSHSQSDLITEMHSYYEDLILLGNFQDEKRMFMHLATLKKEAQQTHGMLFNQNNNTQSNIIVPQQTQPTSELAYYQQALQNSDLEQLFSQATVIQLSSIDYYSTVVIKTLLQVLLDQSLQPHHELALETLMWIIGTLKIKTSYYLQYLIPVFARLLQRMEEMREKVLSSLEKVIRLCGINFGQQYIDQVIGCVMLFAQGKAQGSNVELKAVQIGMEILGTLIQFSKNHLRHKIEPIVRMINNQIVIYEEQKEVIKKAIHIYRSLEELLDAQLHMIVPFMCKLILKEVSSIDQEVRREIIHLFVNLSQNCPSTVQYLSLIINCLINLMELVFKQQQPQQTHQNVMNCFAILIKQYKNVVLVYLPIIHQAVQKYKINHSSYEACIRIFLNYGTLEDINNLLDDPNDFAFFPKQSTPTYALESVNPPMYKKLDSEELMTKFDTSQRTLKDEWVEWMRNTSVELLKQSPMLVLSPCSSIAEMYPQLANELYNIAFDSVWQNLNDKHKELMISHLTNAISPKNAENIPLSILQTILNLAEFMQHDKEGLQIDIQTLAELAERCMAFAKALYYREQEFEFVSIKTIQMLISLYTNLGLPESANGLLTFAKQNLKMQMKITDYERLQKWDEALDDYRKQQLNSEDSSETLYFVPKMRCFNALMHWNQLIKQVDDRFEANDMDLVKQVSHLASNAAMHLGQWDKLERFTEKVGPENPDKPLWNAALAIHKNDFDNAKFWVAKGRERLDAQVSGLLLESYERAQEGILKLQQLTEMEEIIELKTLENRVKKASVDIQGEYSYTKLVDELETRKKRLQDIWADRLHGAPKEVEVWYKILSTRQLYLPKNQDLDTWIKFARLALKRKKVVLCQDTLEMLESVFQNEDEMQLPYQLKLITLECEYMQKRNEKDIVEKTRSYFSRLKENKIDISCKVKAKTYFTLGQWVYERTESFTKENLEYVNSLFYESLQFNPSYAKAWHHYALTNFEAVENFSNEGQNIPQEMINKHVYAAVKGFSKSISLGFKHDKRGRFILQDTLRLLSLIFKYGALEEVAKEFSETYKSIDIIAWINVVPQILARIQITNLTIQSLLHHLLIHISRVHPQALIYPLTVACKSKNQIRRVAVLKILNDMKSHSHILVNEALLISEELNRTAILLKESWKEGIQEAWNSYTQDKNKAHVERILRGLHDNMRVAPESLSEISFHQTYGAEIFEAEAWFQRYLKTDDEVCLCQAFDIYYQVYRKIALTLENLKTVYLENVSPKLLATSNCEISVPGLFRPNGVLVKIARFQPKLQVLTSKQHPRKVFIYGNDGKEYHFLLKGHEDLRQDERVMQLFSLVNRLLNNDPETERKDLVITKYSVIPLSHNTGIIGWVQNCDTLQQLIREYREKTSIRANTESSLMQTFCDKYELLPLANKVEIFRNILENTRGEDIQKVLWLKSQNSETWLERRTSYTRSLATMSMVGYLLGLGDRHPSNIMLQRFTGKIVHIDFGDCFEVAMKREKFPERVPFRLTRMLVKAMEACGIEGVYRHTCNMVMRVLRENKESLLAVLDSFVYDPLLTWRLLNTASNIPKKERDKLEMTKPQEQKEKETIERDRGTSLVSKNIPNNSRSSTIEQNDAEIMKQDPQQKIETPKRKESGRQKELYLEFADEEREIPDDLQNQKGLEVIDRIKKKLQGKDFRENETLKYEEQVRELILQATSHENISQAYIGWCPFW